MNRVSRSVYVLLMAAVFSLSLAYHPLAAIGETYYLGIPEEAHWKEDSRGTAQWEKVERAKEYEVFLYKGDERVKRIYSKGTYINLAEYMENDNIYSFAVRAVPTDAQRTYRAGDWARSEEIKVDWLGETSGRWRTYSAGKKFQKEDGTFCAGGWEMIQGVWYHFNSDGYVETGWIFADQAWYYLNNEGEMQTGWFNENGVWYFLGSNGAMQTGWVQAKPGEWYYMDASGRMLADTTVGGHTLDASGKMTN